MPSRLRYRDVFCALFLIGMVTFAVCGALKRHVDSEKARLRDVHAQALKDREWSRVDREVKALEAARQRQHNFHRELEEVLGGPIAAAAKSPNLTISESIEKIAAACAPQGSKVRVDVTRFTEFNAVVELPRQLDESAIAEIARCILAESSTYLYQLEFAFGGRIFAELGRREIESIPDWRNASAAQTKTLLTDPGDLQVPIVAQSSSSNTQDSAEEQGNVSPEMRRQREAIEALDAALKLAQNNFRAAVEAEVRARDMADVRQPSDLINKGNELLQAESLANEAKTVLEDPAAVYAKILSSAGVDRTYQKAALRDVATRFQSTTQAVRNLFAQNAQVISISRDFLETLARHSGNWTYDSRAKTYQFTSNAAHQAIKSAMDRLELADKNAAAAIADWNNAMAAQNAVK